MEVGGSRAEAQRRTRVAHKREGGATWIGIGTGTGIGTRIGGIARCIDNENCIDIGWRLRSNNIWGTWWEVIGTRTCSVGWTNRW